MASISENEALSITVGRWLIEEGYRILDIDWRSELRTLDNRESFGILGKVFKMESSPTDVAYHLGDLSLRKQQWVIKVYGRNSLPEIRELAGRMTIRFGVNILVLLETESRRWDPSHWPTKYPTFLEKLGCGNCFFYIVSMIGLTAALSFKAFRRLN